MDHQDLRRSQSSAVHGAHVCNKCGWSFPNPHPSAKHRRAHKKICGTIQGFKVNNTQHSVSDGEQSDEEEEEPKTPSPKVMQQRTMYDKGSGVISGASMKSDDGLYLDAVAEFSDTASASGTGEGLQESQEGFVNKDLSAIPFQSDEGTIGNAGTQFQEGLSTPDISLKTSYASDGRTEGSNVKYEMVTDASDDIKINATESMIDSCLTSVDQASEVRGITVNNLDRNISSETSSILDGRIEKSNGLGDRNGLEDEHPVEYETVKDASTTSSIGEAVGSDVLLGDRNGSEDDLHPIKHDFITDAPEDIKKTDPTDSMIVGCLTSVDQDSEVGGITATHLDQVASQTCEGASKLQVTDRMTSEYLQADEVAPSEKEHSDGFGIPQTDLPSEVKSVAHLSTSVDTAEEVDHNLIESVDWNPNVHVLSVPSDINVVDDPVSMLEDFRDNKGKQLDQFTSLDSWEQFDDNEKDLKRPVLMESLNSFQSSHLSRGSVVSSDTHNLEASVEPDVGSNESLSRSVPVEEANMSKSNIKMSENQIPDEIGTSADAVMPQIAKTYMGSLPEGQDSCDKFNESLLLNVAANDAGIDKNTHLVGPEDDEKDGNCDAKGESKDHCRKGPVEESFLGNPMDTVHSDGGHYESQIDPAANLDKDDNAVDYGKGSKFGDAGYNDEAETLNICKDERSKGAIENYSTDAASNLESGSCLSELHVNPLANPQEGRDAADDRENDKTEKCDIEASILVKSELDPKSSVIVDGSKDVVDEATDGSKMELVETRVSNLGSSSNLAGERNDSDTQRHVLEKEISCNDKIQKEAVTGLVTGSDLSHNVEPFQNSVENLGMREPGFSAVDTKSSVQSFIASEDSGSSRVVASEFTSQSLQEEGDNNLLKQPSPTAIDVLVDSNSQTDSLEANWGSVSVLSMQSDAEVVPRTHSQASVDENTDMKKSKTENESQYLNKSDVFEAPSFMTLVEPGGGNNKNATGSEILAAVHNPEQPKPAPLQTGWFPSMTHVANESQGRKKNEEIIAKVTNWSTGKQHTPLKSLLGEASLQSKGKSPNQNENVSTALPKDDKASKVSGPVVTTVNSILNPESPTGEAGKKNNAKEWNSPARYPSDAKSDKKKIKGRPSWVHFVCCSSVN